MGDLIEDTVSSFEDNNSNAKVSDPTGTETLNSGLDTDTYTYGEPALRESDNQDSSVKDSAEEVITSHDDMKNESARSPVGSKTDQAVLGPGEVSLPALRVSGKPETNTSAKSAKVDSPKSLRSGIVDGPKRFKNLDSSRAVVDTAAPIESVRDAVSKFGGIADWKTHRVETLERRIHLDQELDKVQEEMTDCKKRSKAAEDAKMEVMNELERTKKEIEELEMQLSLWSSRIKEQSHDRDLGEVNAEKSDAAAAEEEELETVVAHHEAAVMELRSVQNEPQAASGDLAMRKVGEASDDVDITIKELTGELLVAKDSLLAAQAAYKEAEDQRSASVVAFEEDTLSWERELKQVEEEVEKLNHEYLYAMDLRSKLDSDSALLSTLKAELASYIGSRMKQETADAKSKTEVEISKMKILSAKKELEQVKLRTEKATVEVSILKLAASSLKSELDKEKEAVSALKKRVGMPTVTVRSIEEELSRIASKTAMMEMSKREALVKMVDLPSRLQQAAEEGDQAKSLKQVAHEELRRARDEAEQAKAEACTTETRLHATEKEIEATKASEKLALAAIHGLQESKTALDRGDKDSENAVIISLEEYQMLSMSAQEAEEQAKTRLAAALIQIEAAKKSESKSLQRLEEVCQELSRKNVICGTATKKSEKAMSEKLRAEQELRSWRTKNEQRRKASKSASFTSDSRNIKQKNDTQKNGKVLATDPLHHTQRLKPPGDDQSSIEYDSSPNSKVAKKKKKKSLFPRLLRLFGRQKSHVSRKVM